MNREQMIEKAAERIYVDDHEGFSGTWMSWEKLGGFMRQEYLRKAQAVVDALLPQVTTVEEWRAVPVGATLVVNRTGAAWKKALDSSGLPCLSRSSTGYGGEFRYYEGAVEVMTVVWQP